MARRSTVSHDEKNPLRSFVDSTVSVAFSRLVMPMALAIIGWFMTQAMGDIKTSLYSLGSTVQAQSIDVAVLKSKMDNTIKSIERLNSVVTIKNKNE